MPGDRTTGDVRPAHHSTVPDQPTDGWTRIEQSMRALAYVVVFGAVAAALLGFAGLRTREAVASGGATEVRVTYAQFTRPGIATPFGIDITSADGNALPSPLEVQVSSDYLAMFDENGLDPAPAAASSDGTIESWRFDLDPGTTRFHIDFDARLQPNIHRGATGRVHVDARDAGSVDVEFRTWVLP